MEERALILSRGSARRNSPRIRFRVAYSCFGAAAGLRSGCSATNPPPPPGHGRNGAEAFAGAQKVDIAHQNLKHGDRCPECGKGNVYGQKEPKALVRIVGQAPLAATVYSLERLRCGACGQVFTAPEPEAWARKSMMRQQRR